MKPKTKRRWLQFSLRILLVLTLVFAAGIGWLAYRIQWARAQWDAAVAIREVGGTLQFCRSDVVGAAVAWLGRSFGEELRGDVEWVNFAGVGDAGLVHLRVTAQLAQLHLSNSRVSDAGLVHLRGLTRLKVLTLDNTQVSDEGLAHLQGLMQLQKLSLYNTQVSDEGVNELKKALPNVQISYQ